LYVSAEGIFLFLYFNIVMAKFIGERISTEDHPKSTTIVIRPKRVLWKEIVLGFWLAGFTFAGLYVIYLLVFGGMDTLQVGENFDEDIRKQQIIYLIVFTAFWVLFEYVTVKAFFWIIFGKELVMIDTEALSIKKSILGYGKSHRFFFENIKKVSYEKPDSLSLNTFLDNSYWSTGTEVMKVEHKGKTKSFGRKLDDKDAKLLYRFIGDRMKKWRKASS
jgi:hypothetical protein